MLMTLAVLATITTQILQRAQPKIDWTLPDTTERDDEPAPQIDTTPEADPEPFPITPPRTRIRRTPKAPGVYHLEARERYTGSSRNVFGRLINERHTKAWKVLLQPGVQITVWLVVFAKKQPVTRSDWDHALRGIEQTVMDDVLVPPNIAGQPPSANDRRAASPENKIAWRFEFGTILGPALSY
jgi:hypothetical protein